MTQRGLTPPELSRAGLAAQHNLDHRNYLGRTTGGGSAEVVGHQAHGFVATVTFV